MGKNLKGKELGKGLSQRKDGKYSARFITGNGKRVEKYFDKLQEAWSLRISSQCIARMYLTRWKKITQAQRFI